MSVKDSGRTGASERFSRNWKKPYATVLPGSRSSIGAEKVLPLTDFLLRMRFLFFWVGVAWGAHGSLMIAGVADQGPLDDDTPLHIELTEYALALVAIERWDIVLACRT